jgi:hypothetical protein
MNGIVGAVTGLIFGVTSGFITTAQIKERYQKLHPDQPVTEISSLGNSIGYAVVSGIVCGTIGGIISDQKINDSGIVGGTIGGIVAGVASGMYATRDFL